LGKVVIHDYGTFSSIKLFEHAWELFNLIGHGVVMEGNRKMPGCLQTFGGHCIQSVENEMKHLINLEKRGSPRDA